VRHRLIIALIVAGTLLAGPAALAADGAAPAPGSLWQPALRTLASLALVLAVLGGCAWLARRLRAGSSFRSGLIEIVGGISLGGREKVVLLRVGDEQVLVGISPAGMRPLHVLRDTSRQGSDSFASYLEDTP